MTATAHAVVFTGVGQPLTMQTFPLPKLRPGELLATVELCTLCGSDLHSYTGRRSTPLPTILGHEILGRVAELPPGEPALAADGQPLSVGDRIVVTLAVGCGECARCRSGVPQKCARVFKYGHEAITPDHALSGGLASHVHLIAGTPVFHVPDGLPDSVACPAGCATATVMAAFRQAGEIRGRTILIQGAGMLGLTAAAVAKSQGAHRVLVSERHPERREQALHFGADAVLPADLPLSKQKTQIAAAVGKDGVDVIFEMSGAPEAMENGLSLLALGGRYVWVGSVFPARPVAISAETVVRRLLTLVGVHNYAPQDLGTALAFLEAHHRAYPFAELVGRLFPLEQTLQALDCSASGETVRVGVRRTSRL